MRMWRTLHGVLAAAVLVASATWTRAQDATGSDHWLVWVEADGRATTYEIDATGGGVRVVAREPGIHVTVDGERVELVRSELSAPAWVCDREVPGDGEYEHPSDEVHGFMLEAVRASGATTLLEPPDMSGRAAQEDAIEVLATIGPYAVVRRRLWSQFTCAAHLYGRTDYVWIDLRTGTSVDVLAETATDEPALEAAWQRLRADLLAEDPSDPYELAALGPDAAESAVAAVLTPTATVVPPNPRHRFDLADVVPTFTGNRWLARHRIEFTIGDCCESPEALTDGGVPLPARFVDDSVAPAVVRRFLRRFPAARQLGFSEVR